MEKWEQDELVNNLGHNLAQCKKEIQDAIISYVTQADAEYGRRTVEMLKKHESMMKAMDKPELMANASEPAMQGK